MEKRGQITHRTFTHEGCGIHVVSRPGEASAHCLFVHGLGFGSVMWDPLLEVLAERGVSATMHALDLPGHARSGLPPADPTMDWYVEAVLRALEEIPAPVHYVGLSMGGMIGMRLALKSPEKVRTLALFDTDAEEEPNRENYMAMAETLRSQGFSGPLTEAFHQIVFGPKYLSDKANLARWTELMQQHDNEALYRAALAVLNRQAVLDRLGGIRAPTLILVGEHDVATPRQQSEKMHRAMPQSWLEIVPDAGHMSAIERPDAVAGALLELWGGP